jgi:adenylate cyclase
MLARHLSAMAEVVLEHGGTIDKFAGGRGEGGVRGSEPAARPRGVGLPLALAMQARQHELNAESTSDGITELGMGIGVNTGTVIAGTVGGAAASSTRCWATR